METLFLTTSAVARLPLPFTILTPLSFHSRGHLVVAALRCGRRSSPGHGIYSSGVHFLPILELSLIVSDSYSLLLVLNTETVYYFSSRTLDLIVRDV
jgi:hypothetical protein